MKRIITNLSAVALPLVLLSSLVFADISVGVVFSKGEISIIAQWYQDHGVVSGSGNGKKKSKG